MMNSSCQEQEGLKENMTLNISNEQTGGVDVGSTGEPPSNLESSSNSAPEKCSPETIKEKGTLEEDSVEGNKPSLEPEAKKDEPFYLAPNSEPHHSVQDCNGELLETLAETKPASEPKHSVDESDSLVHPDSSQNLKEGGDLKAIEHSENSGEKGDQSGAQMEIDPNSIREVGGENCAKYSLHGECTVSRQTTATENKASDQQNQPGEFLRNCESNDIGANETLNQEESDEQKTEVEEPTKAADKSLRTAGDACAKEHPSAEGEENDLKEIEDIFKEAVEMNASMMTGGFANLYAASEPEKTESMDEKDVTIGVQKPPAQKQVSGSQEQKAVSTPKQKTSGYNCGECGKSLSSHYSLMRHLKTHTKTVKCEECDKMFPNITALKKHSTVHSHEKSSEQKTQPLSNDEKPDPDVPSVTGSLMVPPDDKSRNQSRSIRLQSPEQSLTMADDADACDTLSPISNVGSRERNHLVCQGCGNRFSTERILKNHTKKCLQVMESENVHVQQTPPQQQQIFSCSECNYKWKRKCDLTAHYKRKHAPAVESKFICTICHFSFPTQRALNDHVKVHAKDEHVHSHPKEILELDLTGDDADDYPVSGANSVDKQPSEVEHSLENREEDQRFESEPHNKRFKISPLSERGAVLQGPLASQKKPSPTDKSLPKPKEDINVRESHITDYDKHKNKKHLVPGYIQKECKTFVCNVCHLSFQETFGLASHQMEVHGVAANPPVCVVAQKEETSVSCERIETTSREDTSTTFVCNVCHMCFKDKPTLTSHFCVTHASIKTGAIASSAQTCRSDALGEFTVKEDNSPENEMSSFNIPRMEIDEKKMQVNNEREDQSRMQQPQGTVVCNICQKTFLQVKDLRIHVKHCHPDALKEQHTNTGMNIDNSAQHISQKQDEKKFQCEMCPLAYKHKYDLKKHKEKKHSVEEIKAPVLGLDMKMKQDCLSCSICGEICRNKTALKEHQRTHSCSYSCTACSVGYTRKCDYIKHCVKMHGEAPPEDNVQIQVAETNTPKILCRLCQLTFKTKIEYLLHVKKHEINQNKKLPTMRPSETVGALKSTPLRGSNVCSECEAVFELKDDLIAHRVAVHEIIPDDENLEMCKYCHEKLPSHVSMKEHQQMPTGGEPKCQICNVPFGCFKLLKLHVEVHRLKSKTFAEDSGCSNTADTTVPSFYECNICGKMFCNMKTLELHQEKHKQPGSAAGGKGWNGTKTKVPRKIVPPLVPFLRKKKPLIQMKRARNLEAINKKKMIMIGKKILNAKIHKDDSGVILTEKKGGQESQTKEIPASSIQSQLQLPPGLELKLIGKSSEPPEVAPRTQVYIVTNMKKPQGPAASPSITPQQLHCLLPAPAREAIMESKVASKIDVVSTKCEPQGSAVQIPSPSSSVPPITKISTNKEQMNPPSGGENLKIHSQFSESSKSAPSPFSSQEFTEKEVIDLESQDKPKSETDKQNKEMIEREIMMHAKGMSKLEILSEVCTTLNPSVPSVLDGEITSHQQKSCLIQPGSVPFDDEENFDDSKSFQHLNVQEHAEIPKLPGQNQHTVPTKDEEDSLLKSKVDSQTAIHQCKTTTPAKVTPSGVQTETNVPLSPERETLNNSKPHEGDSTSQQNEEGEVTSDGDDPEIQIIESRINVNPTFPLMTPPPHITTSSSHIQSLPIQVQSTGIITQNRNPHAMTGNEIVTTRSISGLSQSKIVLSNSSIINQTVTNPQMVGNLQSINPVINQVTGAVSGVTITPNLTITPRIQVSNLQPMQQATGGVPVTSTPLSSVTGQEASGVPNTIITTGYSPQVNQVGNCYVLYSIQAQTAEASASFNPLVVQQASTSAQQVNASAVVAGKDKLQLQKPQSVSGLQVMPHHVNVSQSTGVGGSNQQEIQKTNPQSNKQMHSTAKRLMIDSKGRVLEKQIIPHPNILRPSTTQPKVLMPSNTANKTADANIQQPHLSTTSVQQPHLSTTNVQQPHLSTTSAQRMVLTTGNGKSQIIQEHKNDQIQQYQMTGEVGKVPAVNQFTSKIIVTQSDAKMGEIQQIPVPNKQGSPDKKTCSLCDKVLKSPSALQEHLLVHMGKQPKCELCNKTFTTKRGFNNHVLKLHNNILRCSACNSSFTNERLLQAHMMTEHSAYYGKVSAPVKPRAEQPLSPTATFLKPPPLKSYSYVARSKAMGISGVVSSAIPVQTGNVQKPETKAGDKEHIGYDETVRISPPEETANQSDAEAIRSLFKCSVCCRMYPSLHMLLKHKRFHKQPNTFKCFLCRKAFRRAADLKRHRLEHKDKRLLQMQAANHKLQGIVNITTENKYVETKSNEAGNVCQAPPSQPLSRSIQDLMSNNASLTITHLSGRLSAKPPCASSDGSADGRGRPQQLSGEGSRSQAASTMAATINININEKSNIISLPESSQHAMPAPPQRKRFPCTMCSADYASKTSLKKHVAKKHASPERSVQPLNASNPGSNTPLHQNPDYLRMVLKSVLEPLGAQDIPLLSSAKSTNPDKILFLCGICRKIFPDEPALDEHHKIHKSQMSASMLVGVPTSSSHVTSGPTSSSNVTSGNPVHGQPLLAESARSAQRTIQQGTPPVSMAEHASEKPIRGDSKTNMQEINTPPVQEQKKIFKCNLCGKLLYNDHQVQTHVKLGCNGKGPKSLMGNNHSGTVTPKTAQSPGEIVTKATEMLSNSNTLLPEPASSSVACGHVDNQFHTTDQRLESPSARTLVDYQPVRTAHLNLRLPQSGNQINVGAVSPIGRQHSEAKSCVPVKGHDLSSSKGPSVSSKQYTFTNTQSRDVQMLQNTYSPQSSDSKGQIDISSTKLMDNQSNLDDESEDSHIYQDDQDIYSENSPPMNETLLLEQLMCIQCTQGFNSKEELQKHFREHLQCSECPMTFDSVVNLQEHKQRHVWAKSLRCRVCEKTFQDRMSLHEHWKSHMKCEVCKITFKDVDQMVKHREKHSNAVAGENLLPSRQSLSNVANPLVQCGICKETFENKWKLRNHSMKVHSLKPHTCPECRQSFENKVALKDHIKVHLRCDKCGKEFDQLHKIRRHLKTHDEKMFKCNVCSKTFFDRSSLNRHQENVHNEKHYSCDRCEDKFDTLSALKVHLWIVHEGRPVVNFQEIDNETVPGVVDQMDT